MPSIGELFIELGVVGNPEQVEAFNKKIKNLAKDMDLTLKSSVKANKGINDFVKGVAGSVTALTGAAIAMNKFTNDLVRSNQAMLDLTRTTDIAQSTFQKWGGIGKMLGVENADQQLASLNDRLFDLMLTGEGARGFQLAGINPIGQDANGVMEQLRARVSGMDDTTASYLLRQMGTDPKMLHLLRMSRQEFEELGATIRKYQLNEKQRRDIQDMNMQLQISGMRLKYLKDRAILAIMPYWTKFMESLAGVAEMLAKVGKEVGKFIVKWRGLVGGFVIAMARLEPVKNFFSSLSKSVSSLITKIPFLGRTFAALGGIFAKALLPLTALYLLLDDIAVYMEGGDSLLGRVVEWAKTSGGEIGEAFGKMFGGDFLGGLSELFQTLIDIAKDIAAALSTIIEKGVGIRIPNMFKKGNFGMLEQLQYDALKNIDPNTLTPQQQERLRQQIEAMQKNGFQESRMQQYLNNLITPQMEQNIQNNGGNTTNNVDKHVAMNIDIHTSQPAFDIQQQLNYARFAMV